MRHSALRWPPPSDSAPALAQSDKGGPVKVVYHLSEGNAQATNAIRNIRNHLTADPSAKIVVVTHAGGVQFLLDGAHGRQRRAVRSRGAGAQRRRASISASAVSRWSATRSIRARSFRKPRWCPPVLPKCRGCSSRKASPTCDPRSNAGGESRLVGAIPGRASNSEEKRRMRAKRVAIAALAARCVHGSSSRRAPRTRSRSTAQALQDGNPAELWEARGEGLWKQPRGPKKVSFEQCDLGLGPGRGQGRLRAAAALLRRRRSRDGPRDAARASAWSRSRASPPTDAKRNPFGSADRKADMEALVAYVTSESRGVKMDVPMRHPKEREAYRARREDVLLPRRPARLRVRDLPRRGRQAHPAAGPAEPRPSPRARRRATRRGPRIACRRASCARSSGGSTTASASSASPSSSSRRTRRSR